MIIKDYKQFLTDIKEISVSESIVTNSDELLKSINAEQVLMGDIFDFNSQNFDNIDILYKDPKFISILDKKGMKKNNIEYTKDCETFLKDSVNIKFFLIFKKEDSEIDPNPLYIVFQSKNGYGNKWDSIKMYKVNGNIKYFYDKLSSKIIELKRGNKNYIYRTSNAGNDWKLQNIQNRDEFFKDIMSNEEIKKIINDGKTSISIIP